MESFEQEGARTLLSEIGATEYSYASTSARVSVMVAGAIFTFLGLLTIFLRGLSLALRKRPLGYDDSVMIIAWLCSIGFMTSSFIAVRWGIGIRNDDAPRSWFENALKAIYVSEYFYYSSIYFIKLSILLMYLRLTQGVKTFFYRGTIAMGVFLTFTFVPTILVILLQCSPRSAYWDTTVNGQCIDFTAFFYTTSGLSIITDIFILLLPVHMLWNLNCSRRQKAGILATFLVAGLSTLASCIRLYAVKIYTLSDHPMQDNARIKTWSFVEINLGLVCGSAAALKPLFFTPESRKGKDDSQRGMKIRLTEMVDQEGTGEVETEGSSPTNLRGIIGIIERGDAQRPKDWV
ncbi:hypothetical protein K470DRAFT_73839 [Piedraia hortae CBS 480.64]|uniref:Rhodopsin domain-containing protein n=1 Tax=Piedraia hortae CBS 480.64 TaxID=1314780 RepID=A0A6A7BYM7_9PEZI|nr:hypothetical protein K470DRAFT_73839 [Piedraia hortae CBS 480.64]